MVSRPDGVRRRTAVTDTVAAVDLGASSGRVMVGRVGPRTLELHEAHRFANDPVALPDGELVEAAVGADHLTVLVEDVPAVPAKAIIEKPGGVPGGNEADVVTVGLVGHQ